MSVGAGKTALGVATCLAFAQSRAMVITPGSVIRGTFNKAFDHQAVGNVLYGLRGGPLIPGCKPPQVLTLDREDGPIRLVQREDLLKADVIITNFHSLGAGNDEDDLLFKLEPGDIDFIVVDEAHIAAAESYQRAFQHFPKAHSLLMSACLIGDRPPLRRHFQEFVGRILPLAPKRLSYLSKAKSIAGLYTTKNALSNAKQNERKKPLLNAMQPMLNLLHSPFPLNNSSKL